LFQVPAVTTVNAMQMRQHLFRPICCCKYMQIPSSSGWKLMRLAPFCTHTMPVSS
jgi:hypothetical protein